VRAESSDPSPETAGLVRFHLLVGWWGLVCFVVLGTGLEAMHGFKVGFYLDVGNEARRLLWTLAHVHGALISLVHVAFAASLVIGPVWAARRQRQASTALLTALVAMPAGFFLGGAVLHADEPGLGILLVPPGALALLVGVVLTARGMRAR
jgi:hypothetical protein